MTILHLSSAMSWRGGEQQIAYLVDGLSKRGIKQVIMTPFKSELSSRMKNSSWSIVGYRKGFSLNPLVSAKLISVCRKEKVDLIHIHDSHAHNFAWIAYLLGLKVPSVLSRRVDFPIKASSYKKYNHKRIKKIICVSHFIKEVVCESVNDVDKVVTVYDGISMQRIKDAKALDLTKTYPNTKGKKIIGNIAALAGHKDHDTFIRGVADYRNKFGLSDVHFMIVGGDGGEEANIRSLIDQLKLSKDITLTGYVSKPIDYLCSFDTFLYSSKMEGLGTSVIDAMAAGIPIVSTRAGGLAEIIEDGKTALAFQVGDSDQLSDRLHDLLLNENLQEELIKYAKLKADSLSVNHMVEGTIEVYKETSKHIKFK